MSAFIAEAGYNREMVFHYAEEVAGGYRQLIPSGWPQEVRSLIADCWHQVGISRSLAETCSDLLIDSD